MILYGQATGAQIAIEFARQNPQRVSYLLLESCGYFLPQEMDLLVDGYLPDIRARADAGHLTQVWAMVRDQMTFFPWNWRESAARLERDPPSLAAHHAVALDTLRAGDGYRHAYGAALQRERSGMLDGVRCAGLVIRTQGGPMGPYTDRMTDLPSGIRMLRCASDPVERAARIVDSLPAELLISPTSPSPQIQQTIISPSQNQSADGVRFNLTSSAEAFWSPSFIDVEGISLRVLTCAGGAGMPLLLLHEIGDAAEGAIADSAQWLGRRTMIVIELPGHGESALGESVCAWCIQEQARLLLVALNQMGIAQVCVLAHKSAVALALEMMTQDAQAIAHAVLANPLAQAAEDLAQLHEHYAPDLAPRWDGGHLLAAWYFVRDRNLYWPWYRRSQSAELVNAPVLEVQEMHRQTVALLSCQIPQSQLWLSLFSYPLAERLETLAGQITLVESRAAMLRAIDQLPPQ